MRANNQDNPYRSPRAATSDKGSGRWLTIRQHIMLSLAMEFGAFGIASVLSVLALIPLGLGTLTIIPVLVILIITQMVVRRQVDRIPSQCPNCKGKSFRQSVKPFTYRCVRCKYEYVSKVRMNA